MTPEKLRDRRRTREQLAIIKENERIRQKQQEARFEQSLREMESQRLMSIAIAAASGIPCPMTWSQK